jgi:hypothetical protein
MRRIKNIMARYPGKTVRVRGHAINAMARVGIAPKWLVVRHLPNQGKE